MLWNNCFNVPNRHVPIIPFTVLFSFWRGCYIDVDEWAEMHIVYAKAALWGNVQFSVITKADLG